MNFFKKPTTFIFLLAILANFLFIGPAFAGWEDYLNIIGEYGFEESGTGAPELSVIDIIGRVVNTVLGFLVILFLTLIIYGGHMWMFAGGNEERVGKAKKILRNSVIGVAIVLLSWSITYTVFQALGAA